ncbi:MAG TPA: septal ring lytic transglycosylase RlpA family protein [bacterium]|nr:septal ring lytic transglycosylase RlpA family protein [bacterium]
MKRALPALVIAALMLAGCGGTPRYRPTVAEGVAYQKGQASFYHDNLHGHLTASGEPYDRDELTAAHRSLPFGTRIRVTNVQNGKWVLLTVNDRGPFVKGRVVDVSRRAAHELGFVRNGVVDVTIAIVE